MTDRARIVAVAIGDEPKPPIRFARARPKYGALTNRARASIVIGADAFGEI
jgi:hypothetical protein